MPDYKTIGLGNWLDYFVIKYKVSNVGALGQTCLDQIAVAFMPFIQPDLLKIGLCFPQDNRKNSRINREVIRRYSNQLEQFPLIKNMISYPYKAKTISMRIITGIKRKLIEKQNNDIGADSICHLKDFIFDRVNSLEVKNFDLYDYKKVKFIAESFFNGNMIYKHEIENWLLFDVWREITLQKNK